MTTDQRHDASRAVRLAAELRLLSTVYGVVMHEIGNPLQSMIVLVELTRDELFLLDPADPGVTRLDRALESMERLRQTLMASARVRAGLDGTRDGVERWGQLLDHHGTLVDHRLRSLRAELVRRTDAIDELELGSSPARSATLAALLAACTRIHQARTGNLRLELDGIADGEHVELRVAVAGAEPIAIDEDTAHLVAELTTDVPGLEYTIDAGAIVLRSAAGQPRHT